MVRWTSNIREHVHKFSSYCADLWRDEKGSTWLETSPRILLLADRSKRKPYPMQLDEEALLGSMLPPHLRLPARFGCNTGCREQEVCQLRWDWEIWLEEIQASVFIIPGAFTKNGEDKLVVLNRFARKAIARCRGKHPEFVFTYPVSIHANPKDRRSPIVRTEHCPLTKLNNSAWKRARQSAAAAYPQRMGRECPAGFAKVRVHGMRFTFGYRLRAKGVSLEDRQDLMGHKSGRITTHYSPALIANLIAAVERICDLGSRKSPAFTILRVQDLAKKSSNTMKGDRKLWW